MRTLQSELQSPKREKKIGFDHLNNRIRCYAHIINLCSSHVVASVTSTTKHHLSNHEVPLDDSDNRPDDDKSNAGSDDDSDDGSDDSSSSSDDDDDGSVDDGFDDGSEDDDSGDGDEPVVGNINLDRVAAKLELATDYDIEGNRELKRLLTGIQRDPLSRARKVVRFLRSSDQRREGFRDFITGGNQHDLFFFTDKDKNRITVKVPQLELLRDVKTRWDSVYLMLERLRQLRPVSSSQ